MRKIDNKKQDHRVDSYQMINFEMAVIGIIGSFNRILID